MTEEVHTGGLRKFRIGKSQKIEQKLSRSIDKAYEKAKIRKAQEKRRNRIIIAIIVILILLVLLFLFLR